MSVPAGTSSLSAKTDWNLRRKLAVALDGYGQATINFTGTATDAGGNSSTSPTIVTSV